MKLRLLIKPGIDINFCEKCEFLFSQEFYNGLWDPIYFFQEL